MVTPAALESKYIEREVLQAQKENKPIIPCFYKDVGIENITLDLDRYQGFEFKNEYHIASELYSKIAKRKINAVTTNKSVKLAKSYSFLKKFGREGKSDGQFNYPSGIAVDSSGYVYVADFNNYRIQQFDSDDTFISKWGSKGEEDGQFNYPDDIAVDSGYVYVSDRMNHHIQVFSPSIN